MADKAISELVSAEQITANDMFVLEQNGTAKKLTGHVLLNWLTAAADGHGGIKSIEKLKTNILADTYRITLADTTTFDFVVNNGRGISGIAKVGTSGLVDTYRISYNDGTTSTFSVSNGAKGDKGDNTYIWVKYASQEPTASSNSFGDLPDDWMGVYFGTSSTAPTNWQQYKWYQIKGEKGDTGDPARLTSSAVEYQVGDSGTIIPSGAWSSSVPVVAQGRYMWTRVTNTFNTGSSVVSYSVSRMGIDGTGSVSSVAGISPNFDGNVPLTAKDVGALPSSGGAMTGALNMNGQKLSGLNAPKANDEAATKAYVDNAKPDMTGYATEKFVSETVGSAIETALDDVLTQKLYHAQGEVFKATSGGTAKGSGVATVHITPDGVAQIDFVVRISTAGSNTNVFGVGISVSLLRSINANIPEIVPAKGGNCIFFNANGSINTGMTEFGGSCLDVTSDMWNIGRIYDATGSYGSWPDSMYTSGMIVKGTLYGIVSR